MKNLKTSTKNYFDKAAQEWDIKPGRLERIKILVTEIKHIIRPGQYKKAMEFGCGTGTLSFLLEELFEKFTLVDNSRGMLDVVHEKITESKSSRFKTVCINLEEEDLPESFDVIYTFMSLHHVLDVDTVLEKFSKMLTPGGLLIIADLDEEDGHFHHPPENEDLHFGFNQTELENKLLKHGLTTTTYKIFHKINRQNALGETKDYPLFFLAAKKHLLAKQS